MGKPKQITKEDLIRAVKQQLLQKGHNRVTLKNVAEQAGVTQGVVYYHFKTKDQLFISLLQDYLENVVFEEFEPFRERDSLEGMKAYLKEKAYQVHVKTEDQPLLFQLAELSLHHKEMKKVMGKIMQERVKEINTLFHKDEASGRILMAALDGLTLQALFDPTFEAKDLFNQVYELLLSKEGE